MPYDNTKYVVDKYLTDVLDIDFEDESIKAKLNWSIYNETVLQAYYCH